MSFVKKVVIVTGASSGIGAAAAISFSKEGANVVLVGRNEYKLQKVKEECAKTGNDLLVVKADVSKEQDAEKIIKETVDKFNKIDILVNNAGIVVEMSGILGDKVLAVYDSVMNTNLRAVVHITHLAVPYLIKSKGNIINISSVAGKMTMKTAPALAYSISKAALDHFTRCVAAELAPRGVRVNSVSPGPVKTDILDSAGVPISIESMAEIVALGRVSEAQEVADLILFLASDKAIAITGSDYVTDNGALLK
ncbi:3-oxoacyl-[acyl-carrier-protein] reductase FabG-like [Melitaea cinxia]|uniref:3-oxoacyl-[acyl-carrier-protein] reductase FabG-like n=1 Tax=Melitaea cinxia TaxID=113334 RepID=UPI001E2731E8|nr:3-oxoacyl-[acyl-carrier-protein] reductase FabG-like [Melitaea cinxia]